MIYAYIPLIAVAALAVRFAALPKASVRWKCIVGGVALASIVAFFALPVLRSYVVLLQIAVGVYQTFHLMVASDAH